MKKLLCFLITLFFVNFIFAEEYQFHGKDENGTIRNISIIISENKPEYVQGFYREDCFLEKQSLYQEFTAYNKNGNYIFTVSKDKLSKEISFTYDYYYLYYKSTANLKNNSPLFTDFSCQLMSLTFMKKQSVLYIMQEGNNQNIKAQFYKEKAAPVPYKNDVKLPESVKAYGKNINFSKRTKWYETKAGKKRYAYTYIYSNTQNFTAIYIAFDITDPKNIKTYYLKTFAFDIEPMYLCVSDSELVFLQTELNYDTIIQSDFVTKPWILGENGFTLLDQASDYIYFNIITLNKNNIGLVQFPNFIKQSLVEKGFSVKLKILKNQFNKIGKYSYIVISDKNDSDLKLIVWKEKEIIVWYNIPSVPEINENEITFIRENINTDDHKMSQTITFNLEKEIPSKLIIFDKTYKANK